MVVQPVVDTGGDAGGDAGGTLLTDGQPRGRVFAADVGLDGMEIADEGHAFLGNRRGTGAGDLDELAAGMDPAMGKPDTGSGPVRSRAIRRLYPA